MKGFILFNKTSYEIVEHKYVFIKGFFIFAVRFVNYYSIRIWKKFFGIDDWQHAIEVKFWYNIITASFLVNSFDKLEAEEINSSKLAPDFVNIDVE